jgi:hypothetical protein
MENWKPITEAPGYEISDKGRIRSTLQIKSRIMRPKTKNNGYLEITLRIAGKPVSRLVHRLVAIAFLAPDLSRPTVNHINGKKTDNKNTNLAWSTLVENNAHSAHKRVAISNPKRAMKLTYVKVQKIRNMHATGTLSWIIAERFDVSPATVRNIVYGRSWKPLMT